MLSPLWVEQKFTNIQECFRLKIESLHLYLHSTPHGEPYTRHPASDLRDKNVRPGLESRFEGERRVDRLNKLLLHVDTDSDNVSLSNTMSVSLPPSAHSFVVGRYFFHKCFINMNIHSCEVILKLNSVYVSTSFHVKYRVRTPDKHR